MSKGDVTIRKNTKDNWYPCFPGNRVELMFIHMFDGSFRVAVWGNDDAGAELDTKNRHTAIMIFQLLSSRSFINWQDLYKIGFVHA